MAGSKRPGKGGPGTWELRVDRPPGPDGKRRPVSRTFKGSARAADKALAALWTQVQAEAEPTGRSTFGELLDRYIAWQESVGRSPRTTEGYKGWRRRELGSLENVRLDRLTTLQIDDLYAAMLRRGMDPRSVRAVHALIHGALKQGKKWGLVATNVATDATKPRVEKTQPKAPSPVQVNTLLAAVTEEDPDFFVFLRLAAASGTRRGEVCGFQWRDIDADACTIRVERAVISTPLTGTIVKDTKTHATAEVPLDRGTIAILAAHRARCEERAAIGEVKLRPTSFLFSMDLDGSRPLHPDTPSHRFARLRAKIPELAGVQLRQLRHYVGTQILERTGDLKAAQSMLRHASGTTTLEFYAAAVAENTRRGSNVIGGLLDG